MQGVVRSRRKEAKEAPLRGGCSVVKEREVGESS